MPKQATTIFPLLCDLCPKKPRFSDVSHLLTHISSKSHLSNRFKLQIRSQGEPEARTLLASFDSWYTSNGLEDLLSERLAAKEQKKTKKRTRLPSASAKPPVKNEMKAEGLLEQQLVKTPIYRPPIPRMHSWSTDPYIPDAPALPEGNPWTLNSAYETPTMKRNLPNFAFVESPASSSIQMAPTPLKADDTDEDGEKEGSKLKGVCWPGMALFDSATAEMKRMRNQKKDGTALQQMQRSSARIEPTEWVFNPDGEFRKTRDIFDESTDSSPERSVAVAPTPKKRRMRKGVLADISTNAPRLRLSVTKQPPKSVSSKRRLAIVNLAEAGRKKTAHQPHLSLSTGLPLLLSPEEHNELRLTMGELGTKRKLGIFRDSEDSPARTESPLEDHRFEFSPSRTVISSKSGDIAPYSPTPVFKPVPMRFAGKENFGLLQMNRQFVPATPSGLSPNMFHSDSLNPLYTHSHAHAQAFSYGARQNLQADLKPAFASFINGEFKPLTMTDPFKMINEFHGLPKMPGSDLADNIRYGM